MKKISLIIMFLVMCTIIGGCAQTEETELSELQITACNSADAGGTCDSKLPELELVTTSQCCEILGKCC